MSPAQSRRAVQVQSSVSSCCSPQGRPEKRSKCSDVWFLYRKCDSALLTAVDNYAVLQLDIVWCHRALEALSCLDDAKSRLQTAERCFLQCYGEQQTRLKMIKVRKQWLLFVCEGADQNSNFAFVSSGKRGQRAGVVSPALPPPEPPLLPGRKRQSGSRQTVRSNYSSLWFRADVVLCWCPLSRGVCPQVESLYGRLCPDSDKMNQLMVAGFTEPEARLALRACQGDLQQAFTHITNSRLVRGPLSRTVRDGVSYCSCAELIAGFCVSQEKEELKQRERQKRRTRIDNISTLTAMGYSRRDAARALHRADGDVNKACGVSNASLNTCTL